MGRGLDLDLRGLPVIFANRVFEVFEGGLIQREGFRIALHADHDIGFDLRGHAQRRDEFPLDTCSS